MQQILRFERLLNDEGIILVKIWLHLTDDQQGKRQRIDPALLEEHIEQVKTGLPGVAWLKLDADADWPAELEVNVGH